MHTPSILNESTVKREAEPDPLVWLFLILHRQAFLVTVRLYSVVLPSANRKELGSTPTSSLGERRLNIDRWTGLETSFSAYIVVQHRLILQTAGIQSRARDCTHQTRWTQSPAHSLGILPYELQSDASIGRVSGASRVLHSNWILGGGQYTPGYRALLNYRKHVDTPGAGSGPSWPFLDSTPPMLALRTSKLAE